MKDIQVEGDLRDVLDRLEAIQEQERRELEALRVRVDARDKTMAGIRSLLDASDPVKSRQLVEYRLALRATRERAIAGSRSKVEEDEHARYRAEARQLDEFRRRAAEERRLALRLTRGGRDREGRDNPIGPDEGEGDHAPRMPAGLITSGESPDERAESLKESTAADRPASTVAGVVQIVTEASGPLTRRQIRSEFDRRGWVEPRWKHPDNAIGNAIRRATQRDGSLVEVLPGLFEPADRAPKPPASGQG